MSVSITVGEAASRTRENSFMAVGAARTMPQRLVGGTGQVVDDLTLPRMVHSWSNYRSTLCPLPALSRSIDTAALACRGVIRVITGKRSGGKVMHIPGSGEPLAHFQGYENHQPQHASHHRALLQGEPIAGD